MNKSDVKRILNSNIIPFWCRYISIDEYGDIVSHEDKPYLIEDSWGKKMFDRGAKDGDRKYRWMEKIGGTDSKYFGVYKVVVDVTLIKVKEDE